MEGVRKRRSTRDSLEEDLVSDQGPRPGAVSRALDEGILSSQGRHAKRIPLRKPGKDNYKVAKSWRPISLLATLGKVLESVVAERISHVVETYGLLPTNHFGARKQRSAEQALVLLQEQIYTGWRGQQVSLIGSRPAVAHRLCADRRPGWSPAVGSTA